MADHGMRGIKAIGAAQDAARMSRVVNFYAGLPRGPAPEVKPTGLLGRYQARYFGKNASAARESGLQEYAHMVGFDLLVPPDSSCTRYRWHPAYGL